MLVSALRSLTVSKAGHDAAAAPNYRPYDLADILNQDVDAEIVRSPFVQSEPVYVAVGFDESRGVNVVHYARTARDFCAGYVIGSGSALTGHVIITGSSAGDVLEVATQGRPLTLTCGAKIITLRELSNPANHAISILGMEGNDRIICGVGNANLLCSGGDGSDLIIDR